MLLQSIIYSNLMITFFVFSHDALTRFVNEWSPSTIMNMLASKHAIRYVKMLVMRICVSVHACTCARVSVSVCVCVRAYVCVCVCV